tara:strand:+ start:3542 stop:3979 length:438 start_codon:yes stop_codon:yes gene_type:complete
MNGRTARAGAAIALVAAAYAGSGATATAAGNPPEINYMLHCQGCHLPGGIGHPGIVPKMQGEIGAFLASAAGRAYLVQVPGAAQSSLDDAELAAVLNWMLPAFDTRVNADFTRFTAEEVARYRETQLTNVSSVRRAILSGDSTAE